MNTSFDHPNRKNKFSTHKSYKAKPYSIPLNHRVNALEEKEEDEDYPKIFDYYFSINVLGLLYAIQDIGNKIRWPKKNDKASVWKYNLSGVLTTKIFDVLLKIALPRKKESTTC